MKAHIILCHPDSKSFCASLACRAEEMLLKNRISVTLTDLYQSGFNPVLSPQEWRSSLPSEDSVLLQQKLLAETDLLLFFHPEWWGQMPALLKGWCDRVLRQDVAYERTGPEEGPLVSSGLLSGKKALVCITSDRLNTCLPLTEIWKNDVFSFCGISDVSIFPVMPVSGSTYRWRQHQIVQLEQLTGTLFQ